MPIMPLSSDANLGPERRLRFDIPLVRRLIERFTRRVEAPSSPLPWSEEVGAAQTGIGVADVACAGTSDHLWRVQHSRWSVYRDLDDMDREDPLIPTALDVIADCVTGYEATEVDSFDWELRAANPAAVAVLDDLKLRLNLGTEAWHIVRNFVKFGEEYREVVLDDRDRVARFVSLPAYTIVPKTDDRGNQNPGWYQYPDLRYTSQRIEFAGWQLIDFIYGARRGHYGTGLMMPARRTWRRLEQIQDGMAIARQLRAYDKFEHRVPVRPEWNEARQQLAVKNYKENMTKRKVLDCDGHQRFVNNPLTVETDFYIPEDGTKRGGISLVSAQNVQLSNIADVEYHQKLLLARTKVPRKFMNLGRGEKGVLTDGSLTAEDIQFARTLRNAQAVLRYGLVRLGAFALFLQGYDWRDLGLTIRMPKISTTDALQDANIALTWAKTAEILGALLGGLPPELLMTHYMHLTEAEQELLRSFVTETAKRAEREATDPSRPEAAREEQTPEAQAVRPRDLARTITRLQTLVQEELTRRGHRFEGSEEDRYRGNLEHILNVAHAT